MLHRFDSVHDQPDVHRHQSRRLNCSDPCRPLRLDLLTVRATVSISAAGASVRGYKDIWRSATKFRFSLTYTHTHTHKL